VESAFLWLSFAAWVLFSLAVKFKIFKVRVARRTCAEQSVQADVLPRSVSRHFSARKAFPVSSVGSRGNPQLTQTVGRVAAPSSI